MKLIPFRNRNRGLVAPEGQPDVEELPAFLGYEGDQPVVVTCWEPTWRERFSFFLWGRLWLTVGASALPPMRLVAAARFGLAVVPATVVAEEQPFTGGRVKIRHGHERRAS